MLACVLRGEPGLRLRDIAARVGLTERTTHRLLCELEDAGYLTRHKVGRRNFYEIDINAKLRHPLLSDLAVGDVMRPGAVGGREGGRRET